VSEKVASKIRLPQETRLAVRQLAISQQKSNIYMKSSIVPLSGHLYEHPNYSLYYHHVQHAILSHSITLKPTP
jgi:hypothetical protein